MSYSLFIYSLSSFGSGASTWLTNGEYFYTMTSPLQTSSTLTGTTAEVTDNDALFHDEPSRAYYQTLTTSLTIGSTSYSAGSQIQIGYRFIAKDNATGEQVKMATVLVNGQIAGVAVIDPDGSAGGTTFSNLQPDTTYSFVSRDSNDTSSNLVSYDAYVDGPDPTDVTCFASGTLIETAQGARPVEALAQGDLVVTRDHGLQPIRWAGGRPLSARDLAQNPQLRPIRIRAGALGDGQPAQDLLVSPQHRILIRSRIAQRMFGTTEVLAAARLLCALEGVDEALDIETVTYHHILFDRHEIVCSNGAETESLFTGTQALKAVGRKARNEIFALFPELANPDFIPQPARPLPPGKRLRKLAERHAKNTRAVCEPLPA